MTDWTSLGIGLGLALAGGMLITLGSRRWSLCPLQNCPALETGQRVAFTVAGKQYATALQGVDGDSLILTPPLERGLPMSFEAGTFAEVRLTTPAGVYEAHVQFVGRRAHPQPCLIARVASRWRHIQRRRYERVLLPDEVTVALQVGDDCWVGWAHDASQGGLRLNAPVAVAPSAPVVVEIPAALSGILCCTGACHARVVACERAPTRYGYMYQLRLAFVDG